MGVQNRNLTARETPGNKKEGEESMSWSSPVLRVLGWRNFGNGFTVGETLREGRSGGLYHRRNRGRVRDEKKK